MKNKLRFASPLALAAIGIFAAAPAAAQTIYTTDVNIGVGAASNPYLETGPVESSASASISIRPRLTVIDSTTTFNLGGYLRLEEYEADIRSNDSVGVNGSVTHSISPRTQISGQLGYSGTIVGVNEPFFNPPAVIEDVDILPPVADDIALNGFNQRRHSFQTGASIAHSLTPKDSINLNLSATAIRFADSFVQDEYNFFNTGVGYTRVLSERTSIGASVGLGFSNYLDQRRGDSTIITPSFNITQELAPDLTLSGSIGASFSRVKNIVGETNSTDLSASANLCRRGEFNRFCISASRDTLPSSFDGIRSQTSFSLAYSQRITRNDDISVRGSYSRSSNAVLGTNETFEYLRASATLNHRFQERISGFVTVGYSDSFQDTISRKANTQVRIGISLRFGNSR